MSNLKAKILAFTRERLREIVHSFLRKLKLSKIRVTTIMTAFVAECSEIEGRIRCAASSLGKNCQTGMTIRVPAAGWSQARDRERLGADAWQAVRTAA